MTSATIGEALATRAVDCPDKLAFVIEGEAITFRQLHEDAAWQARQLSAVGLGRGSRCAVMLPTSLDFVRTVYASLMLGAVPVAVGPELSPAAQDLRLSLAAPSIVMTTDDHAERLRNDIGETAGPVVITRSALRSIAPAARPVPANPAPEDIAYLQFTSGTTGAPRACAVSHRALTASLAAMRERYDLTSRDVLANWLPLHYSSGLVRHVFGTVSIGCPSFLIRPSATGLGRWLHLISEVRATGTTSPGFAYRLAARMVSPSDVDLRSLRIATIGGETVQASTITAFEARFGLSRVVQPAYGLTEGTLAIASCAPGDSLQIDDAGFVSCGRSLSGVEMRAVDAAGAACPAGVEGELQIRGDVLFSGYLGDDAGTREAFRDGWLQPGDRGVIDGSGCVYVRSRTRALIKRGGAGISPKEIEEPVERLAGVLRAAAIGLARPGASTEDIVVVVEVLEAERGAAARLAVEVQRVAAEAVGVMPTSVVIVPESAIPRTATGKVRLAELRTLVSDPDFLRGAYFSA
jgi:acyl-CoA synthetase (AMP-forming)/AMP-acid ligase II